MNAQQLITRTNEFAISCLCLAECLPETRTGNHIRSQLIRCSTSVAANYRASRLAQSTAGFISKLSIVIEEADETEFWIDLAISMNLLNDETTKDVKKEAYELASIFISSRRTMLNNQKASKLPKS